MAREPAPTSDVEPNPPNRLVTQRRVRLLVLATVIAVLTWPLADLTPGYSVDDSFGFAVAASLRGFYHGIPVTQFTYGPLGALSAPTLWSRPTALLAVVALACAHGVLCLLALHRAERVLPWWAAAILVLLAARLMTIVTAETAGIAVVLLAVELAERGTGRPRWWLFLGPAIPGLLLLVKFSTGALALGAAVVVAIWLAPGSRRPRAALGAAAAGLGISWCFVIFAGVTGQPTAFPRWLVASYQIAAGYNAMAFEEAGRADEYYYAAGLLIALVILAIATRRRPAILVCGLICLATAVIKLREGFVRHDAHVLAFLGAMAFLPLLLPVRRKLADRILVVGIPVACLVVGVHASVLTTGQLRSFSSGETGIRRVARQLFDPAVTRQTQLAAQAALQAKLAIPSSVLTAVAGKRVQVDPFDTEAIFAYGLTWGPTQVWADYSAYTPYLDGLERDSLSGRYAPEEILRRTNNEAVDARFPPWEAPRYQLRLLCSWREVARAGNWQVLAPSRNRCGARTSLGSAKAQKGQPIPVPLPVNPADAVVARIVVHTSLADHAAALLLKPLGPTFVTLDKHRYRLVTDTSPDGSLIVRQPSDLPVGPGNRKPTDVSTLTLTSDLESATISFTEIAIAP